MRFRLVVGIFLTVTVSTALAEHDYDRDEATSRGPSTSDAARGDRAESEVERRAKLGSRLDCKFSDGPSWKSLEAEAKKHATLDDFLAALKKTSPGFFKQPALVFASQSAQAESSNEAVTAEAPRLIATDGRFALGMIGNRKHRKYDELEIFEYIPEEGRYEPRRIRFPGKDTVGREHSIEGGGTCFRCHGDTPRPNWMTYSTWPGIYGQRAGHLPRRDDAPENLRFARFLESSKDNPRYQLFREKGSANGGFGGQLGSERTNDQFSRMNYCRMGKQLTKSKLWPRYKYAVVGTLRCGKGGQFLPGATALAHEKRLGKDRAALGKETFEITRKDWQRKVGEYREHEAGGDPGRVEPFDLGYTELVTDLRFLLEGQADDPGFDMKSWSLNYTPGRDTSTYSYSNGGQGIRDLWRNVLGFEAAEDPDFKGLDTCAAIAAKSREVLGNGS